MNTKRLAGAILAAGLGMLATVRADISYDLITWGSGGNTLGWTSRDAVGGVSSPGTGGNPDGFLLMRFVPPGPPSLEGDLLYTTAAGFIGNYQLAGVKFDFLGYPSSAQALYLESTAAGGSTWVQTFTSGAHGWEGESFQFLFETGWTRLSGSAEFGTAMSEVSLVGLKLQHLNDGDTTFDYGLDNWQFQDLSWMVPEPGAGWMLLAALAPGAALLWRRRARTTAKKSP
jgi:hypothetical protein